MKGHQYEYTKNGVAEPPAWPKRIGRKTATAETGSGTILFGRASRVAVAMGEGLGKAGLGEAMRPRAVGADTAEEFIPCL